MDLHCLQMCVRMPDVRIYPTLPYLCVSDLWDHQLSVRYYKALAPTGCCYAFSFEKKNMNMLSYLAANGGHTCPRGSTLIFFKKRRLGPIFFGSKF